MNLSWIKKVYLYLVSLISLVILVVAGIMLINLALKTYVFPKADQDYYAYPMERLICEETTDPETGEVLSYKDPRCDDPNWEEKAMKQEEERRSAQRQRDTAQAMAMIIVAAPVFYYHWKLARKDA